jgi:hypothetical protein
MCVCVFIESFDEDEDGMINIEVETNKTSSYTEDSASGIYFDSYGFPFWNNYLVCPDFYNLFDLILNQKQMKTQKSE